MVVSKGQGVAIVLAGIALLAFGVVALAHCDQTMGTGFFNICVRNDWAAAGTAAVIVGIVVLVMGAILPSLTAPTPPAPAYPAGVAYVPVAGYAMPYAPAYGTAPYPQPYGAAPPAPPAAAAARACTRCGAPVTVQFCQSCGTQQW